MVAAFVWPVLPRSGGTVHSGLWDFSRGASPPLAYERADPVATAICPLVALSPQDYDAVLFDLGGVLTQTASVNAAAWKNLFDAFLKKRSEDLGNPFVPFDSDADYRRYLDGRSRYDGAAAFPGSRGIDLPGGHPETGLTRTPSRR